MRTSVEIRQERANVLTQARELRTQVEGADAPAEDLVGRFNDLMGRAEALETEARSAEAIEARFAALDAYEADRDRVDPRVGDPLPHQDPANRRHQFSVMKAAREAVRGQLTGLEAEVAQEMCRRTGRSLGFNEFVVPYDIPETRADLSGTGSRPKTVAPYMIDALRARLFTTDLGATFLTDLNGDFAIPKLTTDATAGWKPEGTDYSAGSPVIGQVAFTQNRVGGYVDFGESYLKQSSIDVESNLRDVLLRLVAGQIDQAVVNGAGTGGVPEGVLIDTDIPTVAIGTNGGAITYAKVLELEASVDTYNALGGKLAFVTSPKVRSKMKAIERASNTGLFLWDYADNSVEGHRAVSTSLVPDTLTKGTSSGVCSALMFGDWSSVHIGLWGGATVRVNPFSRDIAGVVRLTVTQYADIQFAQPKALAKILDITTA